jgi:hypothetical protein
MKYRKFAFSILAILLTSLCFGLLTHVMVREVKFGYLYAYDLHLILIWFGAVFLARYSRVEHDHEALSATKVWVFFICLLLITFFALAIKFTNYFGLSYYFFYINFVGWRAVVYGLLFSSAIAYGIFLLAISSKLSKLDRMTVACSVSAVQIAYCLLALRIVLKLISLKLISL